MQFEVRIVGYNNYLIDFEVTALFTLFCCQPLGQVDNQTMNSKRVKLYKYYIICRNLQEAI